MLPCNKYDVFVILTQIELRLFRLKLQICILDHKLIVQDSDNSIQYDQNEILWEGLHRRDQAFWKSLEESTELRDLRWSIMGNKINKGRGTDTKVFIDHICVPWACLTFFKSQGTNSAYGIYLNHAYDIQIFWSPITDEGR